MRSILVAALLTACTASQPRDGSLDHKIPVGDRAKHTDIAGAVTGGHWKDFVPPRLSSPVVIFHGERGSLWCLFRV
jgi:hypothetical protein